MQKQIEERITQLRAEREAGATRLADLDAERAELQQTLLRIDGAVQVLTELLDPGEESGDMAFGADDGDQREVS